MKKLTLFCAGILAALLCSVSGTLHASAETESDRHAAGNWQTDPESGKRSYLSGDGSLCTGEIQIGDNWYLFAPNGVQQIGWQTVGGKRYYYDPESGEPVFGTVRWRGGVYYVTEETGKSVNERLTLEDGIHQTNSEGMMLTGWYTDESTGETNYFDENGCGVTGARRIDGKDYYFDSSGVMQRGAVIIGDTTYLYDESGAGFTGVRIENGAPVYYGTDHTVLHGTAADGIVSDGENRIAFNADGSLLFAYERHGDTLIYTEADGAQHPVSLTEKTNIGLCYYALRKLGCAFWYGCYGQIADETVYKDFSSYYPGYYSSWNDYPSQYGGQVFDCVGLVKSYLWSADIDELPVVNPAQIVSASGMFEKAAVGSRGTMGSCPWTIGTLVFKSDSWADCPYGIHHVGIYIGNGMVVEARGHAYGVVLTTDLDRWTHWAQCPWTENTLTGTARLSEDGKVYYVYNDGSIRRGTAEEGIVRLGDDFVCFYDDGTVHFCFEQVGDVIRYTSQYGDVAEAPANQKTNLGLCYYAISKLGCSYWYDGHGEIGTQTLLDTLRPQNWDYYCSWNNYETQFGGQVFDCSGLITAYLAAEDLNTIPDITPEINLSSTDYYDTASLRDEIDNSPWTIGTLVFRADSWSNRNNGIHHVGIYIGNGMVVEARGHEYGVVLTTDLDRWTYWAQCAFTEPQPEPDIRIEGSTVTGYDAWGAEMFRYETEGDILHYTDADGTKLDADLTEKTDLGLAYYALRKLHCPYWQCSYGQIASQELYDTLSQYAYENYHKWNDYESQFGKQVFDCVGLVKSYIWCETVDSLPVVNWDQAINESQLYDACPQHGTIETCPWKIGTLVFRADEDSTRTNKVHHVGVYIGHGLVMEAKGHTFGVLCTDNRDRWTHWAQCLWTVPNT